MKFKIFEKTNEPEVTILKLQLTADAIELVCCDVFGNALPDGYLLGIDVDGNLYRPLGVNPSLGFVLDDQGRLSI